jgi:RND family efflux transporter MFP subunit
MVTLITRMRMLAHPTRNHSALVVALSIPVLAVALTLGGCGKNVPKAAEAKAETPIHVETANVELAPMSGTLRVTGTLEGVREATVQSETQGRVLTIVHTIGDRVGSGTPIVKVDDELKTVEVHQAEAARLSAEAALDKAKIDLERTAQLVKDNAATKNQEELAELQFKSAAASLKGAQATEAMAKRQLSDAVVKAPIAGVVSTRFVNQGEMLSPGAKVVTIVDDSRMKLRVSVGETDIPSIRVGDKVSVTIDALSHDYAGSVTAISGKADAAHGYEVDVELANTGELKSGMFARATIARPAVKNVPAITKNAIVSSNGRSQVYVVSNGVVSLRSVKVGVADSARVEVTEGLTAGDEVVTFGQSMLHDGSHIIK